MKPLNSETPDYASWLILGFIPQVCLSAFLLIGYGPWATPGAEFLIFPGIMALPVVFLALPFLGFARTRSFAGHVALGAGGLFLGTVMGAMAGGFLRLKAFRLAADRAQPIVVAVTRFEREKGSLPNNLTQLVPEFLPALPKRIPPLELVTGERALKDFHGNPWALQANVATGFINWDLFLYLPNQSYPEHGWGGSIERVGTWAYVHE